MQIRLESDVEKQLLVSANKESRTPPKQANHLLRQTFKLEVVP